MIEVKKVTKTYGGKKNKFTALKNINLTIPSNTSVAILGKSGSGKSTLMHAISGLDKYGTDMTLDDLKASCSGIYAESNWHHWSIAARTSVTDQASCLSAVQQWHDDTVVNVEENRMPYFDTEILPNYNWTPLPDGTYDVYFFYDEYGGPSTFHYPSGLTIDTRPPITSRTINTPEGKQLQLAVKGSTNAECNNLSTASFAPDVPSTYNSDYQLQDAVDFTLNCKTSPDPNKPFTATMELTLHKHYPDISKLKVVKITKDSNNKKQLIDITDRITFTTITANNQLRTAISYQVTDGGDLDQDGQVNGTIVDPIGVYELVTSEEALAETGRV